MPSIVLQGLQVAVVVFLAPLLTGSIARAEAMIAGKRGPSIFQVYRDIWKFLGKQSLIPEPASWIFRVA
ncbi:MAG: hypothetical protein ACYDG3_10620, partial [Bacillati bacterium]